MDSDAGGDDLPSRIRYQFSGKEWDVETRLAYFGARYYDPRTSVWISPDPALGLYLDGAPFGGVYVPPVLNLYGQTLQNPVKYQDPDGEFVNFLEGAAIGAAVDAGIQGVLIATGAQENFDWTSLAVSAGAGATGVGVANLAKRAVQAGRLAAGASSVAGETAISVGEQVVRGEEVSLARAVGDAVLGEGVGELVSRVGRRLDGSPCSFAEGTLVATERGLEPIETIEVGDLVLARNEVTGAEGWLRVLQVFTNSHDSVLELSLATEDGLLTEAVVTTEEHPFYVRGKGWTRAGDVAAGDALGRSGGKWLKVTAKRAVDRPQPAYNLDVAGFDTFFVGENRVWVHNNCGDAGDVPDRLPDEALVARGGDATNQTAEITYSKIGPSRTPGVEGFSAQCDGGTCVSDLGQHLLNKELGVTTVGDVRRAGGDVIPTPGLGSHVTVTDLPGEAASPLFSGNIVTNPNPRKR